MDPSGIWLGDDISLLLTVSDQWGPLCLFQNLGQLPFLQIALSPNCWYLCLLEMGDLAGIGIEGPMLSSCFM